VERRRKAAKHVPGNRRTAMNEARLAAPRTQYVGFVLVPKFLRWRHVLVGGLALHSAKVFPTRTVRTGDRVVDAGCGFGDTAIALARIVGSSGSVVGIDCCDAFLDVGRAEASAAGIANLAFVEADVQSYRFQPIYDFCFSRFGTQFFENPVAGLRNMRRSLKPGGEMTMIVWRALADNPWLALPKQIVLRYRRRRAITRRPAVQVRSRWPTAASSRGNSRSPAIQKSSSNGSTPA